eukprot:TRINITY_DN10493_c0_g1_i2.p2 TRINITY_DN10493_c0_g1~~TRINITY_DN10493_c0_g1_i2.p2  ORF type:complete len:391 (-),score=130.47 TRINITY_DN10493_c0_g1_i2:1582-2727(-)
MDVQIDFDDRLDNPVVYAENEGKETTKPELSQYEELFDNVFKLYDSGDKLDLEYFNDEQQQLKDPDAAAVDPNAGFPFADSERFLMMAKYQVDNIVKIMELSIAQRELTMSRLDTEDLTRARNRNPPNLPHLKALKRNQIAECSEILARGSASCKRAVELSKDYIRDVSALRRCWRITGARSQSSWDRTIYVDCSVTQVPFSAINLVSPNLVALRPDEKNEAGRVKIFKTELISKFGGSTDALTSDPCGLEEVSSMLRVAQSAVLFRDLFQELLKIASSGSNPFYKVFKDKILVEVPGFDRFEVSLKQFPKAGLQMTGLDKCRLAAIEVAIIQEYLNRRFDTVQPSQAPQQVVDSLMDVLVKKVQHFQLRTAVTDKLPNSR